MNEDHSWSEDLKRLNSRLDYLEQLLREQVARIYRIEQHLEPEKTARGSEPLPTETPIRPATEVSSQTGAMTSEPEPLQTPVPEIKPAAGQPPAYGPLYEEWLREKPLPGE